LAAEGNHAEQHIVSAQRNAKQSANARKLGPALRYRVVGFRHIGDVRIPAALDQWPGRRIVGSRIALPQHLSERLRQPALCDRAEVFAVVEFQAAIDDTAKAVRLFKYRVEHGRKIAGRRIDDLQDLGGRGLLLQGLARLGQEPRVLDRDNRLRGEILQQCYFLVREWPYLLAVDRKDSQQAFVPAQGNDKSGAGTPKIDQGLAQRAGLIDLSFL